MNTYRLTPGTLQKAQILKHSILKENYPIALDIRKLHIYQKIVEHGFEHDVDSSYGVILDIPELHNRFNEHYVIYADDEFDSLLVCNIVSFFLIYLSGGKFLRSLVLDPSLAVLRIFMISRVYS